MTPKTCLRCDWHGETKEPTCPNCGVLVYVLSPSDSGEAGKPAGSSPEERSHQEASTASTQPGDSPSPRSGPPPFPTDTLEPSTRSARSVVKRSWWPAQPFAGTNTSAKLAMAAAAVVVVAMVLNNLLSASSGIAGSGPAVAVSPSPSATPQPSPSTTPAGVGPDLDCPFIGRCALTVGGVPFSFRVRTDGWERFGSISINKSTVGSQGAEAIIFWTAFPGGDIADPCDNLLHPLGGLGPSAADLAAAVAKAPGTELVAGPSDVTLGGYPAKHVVLTVRKDLRCDPGFFFTWEDVDGGALWPYTVAGVTINVWTLDVDGTRLFIEAETSRQASPELEREVQQIVRSIRLGPPTADYLLDLDTGTRRPLPKNIDGSQHAASPDGSRIAYVAPDEDGTGQIFVADLDGSRVRQVTHDPVGAGSPAWSPDGTRIAYGRSVGENLAHLFVLDLATGRSTQIDDGTRDQQAISGALQFTTDGSSIVYTGVSDRGLELRTMPVDGGESTLLIGGRTDGAGGLANAFNGSLSPDGTLVTFLGDEGGPGPMRYVANADGTDRRVIPGWASNPAGAWSPDGSRIVCFAPLPGSAISVVDVATGDRSFVAEGSGAIWLDDHTLLVEV